MDRVKLLIARNDNDKPINPKKVMGISLAFLFGFLALPLKDSNGAKQVLNERGYQAVQIIGRGRTISPECRGFWRAEFTAIKDNSHVVGEVCRNLLAPHKSSRIHISALTPT